MIRPGSRTGPFFDRSFGKLRNYPGNFETIEIIYNCRPSGADLRARIFAGTSFDQARLRFEYEPLRGSLFVVVER